MVLWVLCAPPPTPTHPPRGPRCFQEAPHGSRQLRAAYKGFGGEWIISSMCVCLFPSDSVTCESKSPKTYYNVKGEVVHKHYTRSVFEPAIKYFCLWRFWINFFCHCTRKDREICGIWTHSSESVYHQANFLLLGPKHAQNTITKVCAFLLTTLSLYPKKQPTTQYFSYYWHILTISEKETFNLTAKTLMPLIFIYQKSSTLHFFLVQMTT